MLVLAFLVPTALACGGCAMPSTGTAPSSTEATTPATATSTASLHVEGMTCASCSVAIKVALGKLDGVVSVTVDVEGKKAMVTYDPAKVTPDAIAKKVSDLGYPTTVQG